jgi:hypothetical protein
MSNEWYKISNIFYDNIHSYNGMEHNRYTTSIRNLVYSAFSENDISDKLAGYKTPNETIEKGIEIVFNFDYPILNEEFNSDIVGKINPKSLFEKAFITKYFTDEIAFESFAEFQMKLCGKLLEIIPIYNAKCKLLFGTTYKDLFGGYTLSEFVDNNSSGINQNVGTNFPINNIDNSWYKTDDENYATSSSAFKNDNKYHNERKLDKTNKGDIEKISKFNNSMNNIISSTIEEFKYLFMGVM